MDIVDTLPDRSPYYDAVLQALPQDSDTWHSVHRFFIAKWLTKDGYPEAGSAMCNAFVPGPNFGEHIACDFVDLDGAEGLLFVAERLGELILSTPPCMLDTGLLMFHAGEELGEDQSCAILQSARDNPRIAAYLDYLEAVATRRATQRRLFARSEPPTRPQALKWIATGDPERRDAIDALVRHFEPGDHNLAMRWYEAETDPEVLHSYESSLRRLWEEHPAPTTHAMMLLAIYERGSCAQAREFVVRDLLEIHALPPEIRAECVYDASPEVRELMNQA
jgi:hypothetical protein